MKSNNDRLALSHGGRKVMTELSLVLGLRQKPQQLMEPMLHLEKRRLRLPMLVRRDNDENLN
jgi:hypothetical protein